MAMSNHHHTGIYDRHGNYPLFLEHFHKLFAKCQNVLRGRWENFWSSEQTSVVQLVSPEDILNKLIYSLCNPVESNLVEQARQWPGVSSLRASLTGDHLSAKRPEHFFRADGTMPASVSLKIVRPKGFESVDEIIWRKMIEARVISREVEQRAARAESGVKVIGVRRVLKQHWSSRPKSYFPKRSLSPRVASLNKWRRIETLRANRLFLQAYRDAWIAMQKGVTQVVFPLGTFWLQHFTQVECERLPILT